MEHTKAPTVPVPNIPTTSAVRVQVRRRRDELVAAGLPEVPTSTWARSALAQVRAAGTRLDPATLEEATICSYVELAAGAYLEQNRRRFLGIIGWKDLADHDDVWSAVVDASRHTLDAVVRRVMQGELDHGGYVAAILNNAFIDAWRKLRQSQGAYSREDWFGRAKGRRAKFGDDAQYEIAELITKQVYKAAFGADLTRADPFPLAAWAEEFKVDSLAEMRDLVDETIERIAERFPKAYEANLAHFLQRLHERVIVDDGRSRER